MSRNESADLLVLGPALLVRPAGVWADAVAIRGDRIVALGQSARSWRGPHTAVIDARDGLVLPGFVDAHVHPGTAGRNLLTLDLSGNADAQADLAAIAAAAGRGSGWLTGGGWSMEHYPGGLPTAAALDAVTGGRPAFLYNRDVHGAWVNSAALRLAGITAATPDPPDGRIERDARGRPTGVLHEGAAHRFETAVLPAPSERDWQQAILAGQAHLHELGVTGWQDAWVTDELHRAYRVLASDHTLTGRVVGALWWDRARGVEQLEELRDKRSEAVGRYHPGSVKIMIDGVIENRTAAMLESYCDHGGTGLAHLTPADLNRAVDACVAAGFQVHQHAIGDRAVRLALDAIQAARATHGPDDLRNHIAHVQVVSPDDLARFAALGVTATIQPFWAQHEPQMDELTVPALGPERTAQQYPFAHLRVSGARLAMGSDWGVSTADPLAEIEVAVTRRGHPGARDFLPEQRLDLMTAVTAFTAGSAWVNHDHDAGALVVGGRADLVVLDRDPFTGPAEQIGRTSVRTTIASGRVVAGWEAGR